MAEYLEDILIPYAAPLGRLVLTFSAAEAALLELVMLLRGRGPDDATAILHRGSGTERRDRVLALAKTARHLDAAEVRELTDAVADFYAAREVRHRLIHDEFAPGWDEDKGLVVVTAGRKIGSASTLIFSEPNIDEIKDLAARTAHYAKVFYTTGYTIMGRDALHAYENGVRSEG